MIISIAELAFTSADLSQHTKPSEESGENKHLKLEGVYSFTESKKPPWGSHAQRNIPSHKSKTGTFWCPGDPGAA